MDERPGAVTALGILSIIVGSVGLLLYCGCGFRAIVLLSPEADIAELRNIPGYVPIHVLNVMVNLILSSLILTSGIGLLLMGGWARILLIICSFANLLGHAGMIVYTFAVVKPVTGRLPRNLHRELFIANNGEVAFISAVGLIEIIFSVASLILMWMPAVASAFLYAGRGNRYSSFPEEDDRGYRPRGRYDRDEDW